MGPAPSPIVAARIAEVMQLLLDGNSFHDLKRHADDRGWKIGAKQLRRYMTAANKAIVSEQQTDRKGTLARHLAQRRMLYARALGMNDVRTALKVLQDEARLLGLYPKEVPDEPPASTVVVQTMGPTQVTTYQSDDLIRMLALSQEMEEIKRRAELTDQSVEVIEPGE